MAAVDLEELAGVAATVAEEAGALLLERLASARTSVETKSTRTDMVTDVDRASESLIASRLVTLRPGDGLVGEEGTARPSTTGVQWVVDPLDGTTNYLYGFPSFGVSMAAEVDGVVVAGAVRDPIHGETFVAMRGGGAWVSSSLAPSSSSWSSWSPWSPARTGAQRLRVANSPGSAMGRSGSATGRSGSAAGSPASAAGSPASAAAPPDSPAAPPDSPAAPPGSPAAPPGSPAAPPGSPAAPPGSPAASSGSAAPLALALVGTGFSYDHERRAEQAAVLQRVLPAVRDIRRAGAAAIDLCWVALGRLDAFYERGLARWDWAAGSLIASEAGAACVTLDDGTQVAAPPHLIEPLVALITGA